MPAMQTCAEEPEATLTSRPVLWSFDFGAIKALEPATTRFEREINRYIAALRYQGNAERRVCSVH